MNYSTISLDEWKQVGEGGNGTAIPRSAGKTLVQGGLNKKNDKRKQYIIICHPCIINCLLCRVNS